LENEYYRVTLNADGDVASIFDKKVDKELLSAPARLAISYDNPENWPAWNMDWEQEQAAPKAYVSGPAKIRVVEDGPARIALEVTRDTAGSHFVQTVSLSAGDAGKRVEFRNAIDWNTRESNLKATFPLTASNQMATYNWDIGTIQRPTAEPNKFEVPSHQWIDLTDMSGKYGVSFSAHRAHWQRPATMVVNRNLASTERETPCQRRCYRRKSSSIMCDSNWPRPGPAC
jgi:alpha-mannosidase